MIILANMPGGVVNRSLAGINVRRWIYLGQDARRAIKFKKHMPSGAVQIDYSKLLYQVSEQRRSAFVAWIDQVSLSGKPSAEWLFSVPAVKNPYNSKLYLQLCYFMVIKDLMGKKDVPDVIVVESPALADILGRNFPLLKLSSVNRIWAWFLHVSSVVRSALRMVKHAADYFVRLSAAKSVFGSRAQEILKDANNVVFLRSYITEAYSDSDQDTIEKRYYPGLYAYLESNGKTPVFLPMCLNVKKYKELFSRIRESRRRIICLEEFLSWGDYLHFLISPVRAIFYQFHISAFDGHDLSGLVREDFFDNLTEHGFLLAMWCFPFGKRFKRSGLKCETIINWSEYQGFEKSLVGGLKEAFGASLKVIAAHPFCIPPNHISLIPSLQEKILHLIPDKSLVLGALGKKIVSQYLKEDIERTIELTPLFRYASVHQPFEVNPGSKNILALLGLDFSSALFTLDMLLQVSDHIEFYDQILIKLHPLAAFTGEDLLAQLDRKMSGRCRFIGGNLEDHIQTSAVGICGATGTAVELVVRGIPVIVVGETQALTMNYLAYREDADLWQLCFSGREVQAELERFRDLKQKDPQRLKERAIAYRNAYFSSPTHENFHNYL